MWKKKRNPENNGTLKGGVITSKVLGLLKAEGVTHMGPPLFIVVSLEYKPTCHRYVCVNLVI